MQINYHQFHPWSYEQSILTETPDSTYPRLEVDYIVEQLSHDEVRASSNLRFQVGHFFLVRQPIRMSIGIGYRAVEGPRSLSQG